jgi:hypothetical protein
LIFGLFLDVGVFRVDEGLVNEGLNKIHIQLFN